MHPEDRWSDNDGVSSPRLIRVLVAVSAAAAAMAGAGCAAATPPTWPQLFVGLDGRSPGAVPGLIRPIGPDTARSGTSIPTTRQCVTQWNEHAPEATKRWLVAHSAARADITVMTSGEQVIGTSKRYSLHQCAFGIRVGAAQLVAAVAPLRNSGAAWKGELLTYRATASLRRLTRGFNASVKSDGGLRLS